MGLSTVIQVRLSAVLGTVIGLTGLTAVAQTPSGKSAEAKTGSDAATMVTQEAAQNTTSNQEVHILVGRSIVVRTDSRLERVLVGNPSVLSTATTSPNELVITALTPGSSS